MNLRNIIFMGAIMLGVIGLAMMTAIPIGIYNADGHDVVQKMAVCVGICLFISIVGMCISWNRDRILSSHAALRSGFAAVMLTWLFATICGALPFIICCDFHIVDAIFETASGFSTTGASVIGPNMKLATGKILENGLESMPISVLYWRCLLNWLGGIGFVMFALLLLPSLSGGKHLYNAEVPGLKSASDQMTARITNTAWMVLSFYVLLTLAATVAYKLLGMDTWLDAVCHAFATVATGGFSNHSSSFGYYSKPALQWAGIFFMFVASINFALSIRVFMKRSFDFFKDEECIAFIIVFGAVTLLFTGQMLANHTELLSTAGNSILSSTSVFHRIEAYVRTAAFQVVSTMSTTGFATSDYVTWNLPGLPAIILLLMLLGGCAGSTAGGLKFARFLVMLKQTTVEGRRKLSPHLMGDVRLNGEHLEDNVVRQTMAFFVLYICIIAYCTLILPFLCNMNLETAFSSAITAISNVGPGLGNISPANNFGWMSMPAKYLLAFIMVAGRLELYTVLVVISPAYWRWMKQ